jgi:RNA recognition motif-containing protein
VPVPAAGPKPKSATPPTRPPLTQPPLPPLQNDERKLFVGNLAWAVDGLDLEDIFKEFGAVESAQVCVCCVVWPQSCSPANADPLPACLLQVVTDRETGRSRGFGFVIMQTKAESEKAASELAGANIDGRKIVVEFASEKFKEPRPE